MLKQNSGIDWSTLSPKSSSLTDVKKVLEVVPEDMVGPNGSFKTVAGLANSLRAKTNGELSARLIDGKVRVVLLKK